MEYKKEKRDPTENVRLLITGEVKRIDDLVSFNILHLGELRKAEIIRVDELRKAETIRINESIDAERRRVNEQLELRAEFNKDLSIAESKRIDAIRAVDVNAVSVANEKATAQAIVLANQVSQSAETLRSLVAATAATTAQQLTQLTTQLTDRLTSLEKAQYEGKGSGSGMKDLWGYIVAAGMVLLLIYQNFGKK